MVMRRYFLAPAVVSLSLIFLVGDALVAEVAPKEVFQRLDRNQDGKLTREELPPAIQASFDRMDANKDGSVTVEEMTQFRARQATVSGSQTAFASPIVFRRNSISRMRKLTIPGSVLICCCPRIEPATNRCPSL
jgi:hypothetical protein